MQVGEQAKGGQAKTGRLFFAICPDEPVKTQLWKLSDHIQFGRRTSIENIHLTLVFLGSVSKEQSFCLEQAAAKIQPPDFTLHIDRLGYWLRPKALWAGCIDVPDELRSLVKQLQENVGLCGPFQNMMQQEQAFVPHVTLARKVNAVQGKQYCDQHQAINEIEWKVSHFSLMESVTYAEGPVYRELSRWKQKPL